MKETMIRETLSDADRELFKEAVAEVEARAMAHAHKRPDLPMLLEEVAELILSFRGKHDDPPELELEQIASIAINMLWQLRAGRTEHVNSVRKD